MTDTPPPADPAPSEASDPAEAPVLLVTAWHLPRMRSMPRAFVHVRRLDHATRNAPGALWVHRWISRRSLMLTTRWKTEADAHRWLNSPTFARTSAALGEIDGAVERVEQYREDPESELIDRPTRDRSG